jgi:chemotaxis protein MotB
VAAKGGGAWKVAYADFVTAMMAFFLVMWICGQDQKVRKAVSDYFGDPFALNQGVSKTPQRSGALFETLNTGSVPQSESVAMGRGRTSYTSRGENSRITKLVSDWLHADDEAWQYWRQMAQRQRKLMAPPKEGDHKKAGTAMEIAAMQLSQRLRTEIAREVPAHAKGLYEQLLYDALSAVNWKEIAEDLLSD